MSGVESGAESGVGPRDGAAEPSGAGAAPQGCFLAFRNDRLGGRLNAILTAMRLSRAYGAPFRIYWAVTSNSSAEIQSPQDLFSEAFIARHFTTRPEGTRLLRDAIDIGMVARSATREAFARSVRAGTCYLSNAATEQLLLPWEEAGDLACLPELMEEIELSPRVREMIARIREGLKGLRFRSYHLRRGDIVDDAATASHKLWPDKYIPRVIYEWHMRRELARGDDALLVFSDAKAEAAAFAALSPRVHTFDDLIGGEALTALQRDFLELYTMSRSEAIFAPPSSAFSGLAATIGNRRITDIQADLSPPERAAALDELVDRLDRRPETFLSQSDAGQNLPFIAEHLAGRGEAARATAIVARRVEAGLDRAYVYPFLTGRCLAQGDLEGCDRLVELLRGRTCHLEEHWSTALLHGAMADMARENWPRAIRRYEAGSWFFPVNRLASETFWYLDALGEVSPRSTYPYDPGLLRRVGRIYDEAASPIHRLLMERLRDSGAALQQYPANLEVRDWRRIHGKKVGFRFSVRAKVLQQAERLAQLLGKGPRERQPALHSAIGQLLREAGDLGRAAEHHAAALAARPDEPLYLKRQADLLAAAGQADGALATLERAAALSGGHPCYQAELALSCLGAREPGRYVELLLAIDLERSPLVELHLLRLDAMRRRSDLIAQAPRHLERLEELAPGSHRVLALRGRIAEQLGHWDEALLALRQLMAQGRPDATIRSRVDSLFNAYRRAHSEAQARTWFADQGLAPSPMSPDGRGSSTT